MRVILAADHGGWRDKQKVSTWLVQTGYEVIDVSAATYTPEDDFPDVVAAAVAAWRAEPTAKMILWCRSGVGVSIAANRYPGIYCGLAVNRRQVAAATRDDRLNALAMAADFMAVAEQQMLIKTFLTTQAGQEEKYTRRLEKLEKYAQEEAACKSSPQS